MRGRLWVLQWLTQEHGDKPMVHGMTEYLCAVAAAAEIIKMAEKTVLPYPLILYTTHQVGVVLHNLKIQHMTAQRSSG